jgi:hypothetical protein
VNKVFSAFRWALLIILLSFILYLLTHKWISWITYEALFWARHIVEPFLEPYYHGRTGMVDGPYRMIMWGLSLLIELIVYTVIVFLLIRWRSKRGALSQLKSDELWRKDLVESVQAH